MNDPIISPRSLIEVALPLDAINVAASREKQPGIGAHPRGLHLWWARRPLAVARAVIFSQLVHDPEDLWRCQNPTVEPNKQVKGHWTKARARLFKLIEDLVLWQNTSNEEVLERAREEIRTSWRETCELNKDHPQAAELFDHEKLPGLHDPFAGGGAIPLEAQRLGLQAYASDLNPVAVLINKAMIEIPPKFAGRPPVGKALDAPRKGRRLTLDESWPKVSGLAEDVRRYGHWIQEEAIKRIGKFYPPVKVTNEMLKERPDLKPYAGKSLNVFAWLWVHTIKSPNPAFSQIDVPLASTYVLCSKPGKEAYVQPIIENGSYRFTVKTGNFPSESKEGTKAARGANFRCVLSNTPIEPAHIRAEAIAGRMGSKLMAIVAEGDNCRVYLSPTAEQEAIASSFTPHSTESAIHVPIANDPRPMTCLLYGMTHFDHLFTPRQLLALATFSDLVVEARAKIRQDAIRAGLPNDDLGLSDGGTGARAYAEAVSVYLSFAIDRLADYNSSLATWKPSGEQVMQTYKRQALPIIWDFPESNVLGDSAICWKNAIKYSADNLIATGHDSRHRVGVALQLDAARQHLSRNKFVSTDPPYYDNIGYADLSDFFYIWLRRVLREVYPQLFSTIGVPKAEELVVANYRHESNERADQFFLEGMSHAMQNLAADAHPAAPITIYYAFKQSETESARSVTALAAVTP